MLRRLFGGWVPEPQARYGRVAPWLLVGPALPPSGYEELARRGVTHVLDLRSEASDDPQLMERLGLQWRRVPIDDQLAPTQEQLAEILAWLDSADAPPVLYVHCQGGMGRSPTLAIALLIRRGFTHAEAFRFVLTGHAPACPTPNQEAWLDELRSQLE